MKTLVLKSLVWITSIVFLTSCQDKIQIDLDEKSKSISVDAFLNNMRVDQKIRLTYSDSYFSGKTPSALIGASVTLKDLNNNRTINFEDNNDGNYTFKLLNTDTIIYTNHNYELNIKYQSYEYKAFTSCKRTTSIDGLYFKNSDVGNIGTSVAAGNRLFLVAKDVTGPIPDFYWVKVYKNGKFYGRPENIQLEQFGYNNERDGQYFWEEKWATSGPDGGVDPCATGDVARLEIYGISREVHDFLKLGVQMSNNTGMFATTSVNLPTNIFPQDKSHPKAVGMFSISDVAFKEIECP